LDQPIYFLIRRPDHHHHLLKLSSNFNLSMGKSQKMDPVGGKNVPEQSHFHVIYRPCLNYSYRTFFVGYDFFSHNITETEIVGGKLETK
jgi:hypothetical protein